LKDVIFLRTTVKFKIISIPLNLADLNGFEKSRSLVQTAINKMMTCLFEKYFNQEAAVTEIGAGTGALVRFAPSLSGFQLRLTESASNLAAECRTRTGQRVEQRTIKHLARREAGQHPQVVATNVLDIFNNEELSVQLKALYQMMSHDGVFMHVNMLGSEVINDDLIIREMCAKKKFPFFTCLPDGEFGFICVSIESYRQILEEFDKANFFRPGQCKTLLEMSQQPGFENFEYYCIREIALDFRKGRSNPRALADFHQRYDQIVSSAQESIRIGRNAYLRERLVNALEAQGFTVRLKHRLQASKVTAYDSTRHIKAGARHSLQMGHRVVSASSAERNLGKDRVRETLVADVIVAVKSARPQESMGVKPDTKLPVEALCDYREWLNCDREGRSKLYLAVKNNQTDVIEAFQKLPRRVQYVVQNIQTKRNGYTAIMAAACQSKWDYTAMLSGCAGDFSIRGGKQQRTAKEYADLKLQQLKRQQLLAS
jgi:hypothetical protein